MAQGRPLISRGTAVGVKKDFSDFEPGVCHMLRDTMAALMLENGADIRFI